MSNYCPDPGEPENGKRIGSDFRCVGAAAAGVKEGVKEWNNMLSMHF